MNPKLSIIIPMYNTEEYIEQCLLSIVDNDVAPDLYEVLVINDGSTDASPEIVGTLSRRYGSIRLVNQENRGVSASRMNGLRMAEGEYIWFVDSDDLLLPGSMSSVLALLSEKRGLDAIVAPIYVFYEDNSYAAPNFKPEQEYLTTGKDCLKNGPVLISPTHFIVKAARYSNAAIYFPEGIRYEDEYFARTLLYSLDSILVLKDCLYAYRQRPDSFMGSANIRTAPDMLKVYKELLVFLETSVKEKDRGWFRKNIFSLLSESYTRFSGQYDTDFFRSFRKENLSFCKKELRKTRKYFSMKETFWASLLFYSPSMHKKLLYAVHSVKQKRTRQYPA